ncbi:FCD domain-containing protein [Sessilibacter sp. MAH4]
MNENPVYHFLRSCMIEGSLSAGDRLPAERVLSERFSMSRTRIRETLQVLKTEGWIYSRPGGGHFVSDQLEKSFSNPLAEILANNEDSHFDLLEFRLSLEGDCAYYAALRATDVDLTTLTEVFEQLSKSSKSNDILASATWDARFHLAIAEASHNVIFMHVIKSLFSVFQSTMYQSIQELLANNITRDSLFNQHAAIYDAIHNRKPSTAREAAQQHVRYVSDTLQDLVKEKMRTERALRRSHAKKFEL